MQPAAVGGPNRKAGIPPMVTGMTVHTWKYHSLHRWISYRWHLDAKYSTSGVKMGTKL